MQIGESAGAELIYRVGGCWLVGVLCVQVDGGPQQDATSRHFVHAQPQSRSHQTRLGWQTRRARRAGCWMRHARRCAKTRTHCILNKILGQPQEIEKKMDTNWQTKMYTKTNTHLCAHVWQKNSIGTVFTHVHTDLWQNYRDTKMAYRQFWVGPKVLGHVLEGNSVESEGFHQRYCTM